MVWGYRLVGVATLVANGVALTIAQPSSVQPNIAAVAAPDRPAPGAGAASRLDDGLFHLTGRTADGSARFVVDTGASVTVLTAADAARLGAVPLEAGPEATLRTAGGLTAMTWQRLPALRIADQDIAPMDVAVVADDIGRSLLGNDALAQLGTIVIADDRLKITPMRR